MHHIEDALRIKWGCTSFGEKPNCIFKKSIRIEKDKFDKEVQYRKYKTGYINLIQYFLIYKNI